MSLLSEFVFLQHFGRTLSLNNRRTYFIFNYFNFFFDCFLGILSCVIRVSKSFLAALLFLGRLDYSSMGRDLERLDQGYATYVTFIHMEIIHGHPILGKIFSIFRNYLAQHLIARN
jgi:signal transduction histidine kinase